MIKGYEATEKNLIDLYVKTLDCEYLSREEEVRLGKKILKKKDRQAINQLCESCLPLVLNIAKQYRNRGVDYMDLVQEGNLGLIRAAEKFDHRKGFRFTTYASWWIRQSITRMFQDKVRLIRLPAYLSADYFRIRKVEREFENTRGRKPDMREISQRTGFSYKKINRCLESYAHVISLVGKSDLEDSEGLTEDVIADQSPVDPDMRILFEQILNILEKRQALNRREIDIIRARFCDEQTLAQIGQRHKISRERIRQIQKKALKKIQKVIRTAFLKT